MNKPDPKDYPSQSPHDLEWGGIGSKYYEDLAKWEAENKSEVPVRFSKEVSDFIEANAAYTTEDLPNKWYWFPQYYKKVSEGSFVVTPWKDLPDSIKHITEQLLPRNEGEEGDKKLFEKLVYADARYIMFGVWLNENGWQPYDGMDRWINLKLNKTVESLTNLFAEYKKENPEP